MSASIRPFPPQFVFGAATAAFQIEGATATDGRRDSIWDAFCRVPGAIANGENANLACDHYRRYRDDVALMADLGLDAYRFSTSWARVSPDGRTVNAAGLDFYKRLVDELLEAGIAPWLTLYHWDLPQALQERGGWTNRETADRFTDYAVSVHDALGDRVKAWTTLNEPWCSSFLGYTAGVHAPGHRSVTEGMLASHHLLLAHGQGVQALRECDASLTLGLTLNLTVAEPVDAGDPADQDAARRIDGQFNRWFLDPVFRGAYPADILADIRAVDAAAVAAFEDSVKPGDLDVIGARIDALGVNYYHGEYVSGHAPAVPVAALHAPAERDTASPFPADAGIFWHDRGLARTAMQWEVQPEGLTRLLQRVSEEYTAPAGVALAVTENGAAYDDELVEASGEVRVHDLERTEYVRLHLGAVLDAIEAGVDVRGYFCWSLLDNFEWSWGFGKRFGLVHVDYDTQRRTIKDSGLEYGRIIRSRALADAELAVPAHERG